MNFVVVREKMETQKKLNDGFSMNKFQGRIKRKEVELTGLKET